MKNNNLNSNVRKHASVSCILISFLIILLSFFNSTNSALFGNYNANRNVVYIFIALIIFFEVIIYLFKNMFKIKLNILPVYLSGLLLYVLFVNLFNGLAMWPIVVHCFILILWIVTYNYFHSITNDSKESSEFVNKYLFVILFVLFAVLSLIAQENISSFRNQSYSVINLSYYVLGVLPIIILNCNKKNKIITFVITFFIILFSFKRGAIISMFAMYIIYILVDGKINHKKIGNIAKFLIVVFFVFVAVGLVDHYTDGYLLSRFNLNQLTDGSGRSNIYKNAFDSIKEREVSTLLFGTGSNTTSNMIGITSHNDFIEFLYCFGITGLILYLIYYFILIKKAKKLINQNSQLAIPVSMLIIFSAGLALFEGALLNFINLYVIMQFAILLDQNERCDVT